ncbi:HNH endonuclease signature motif containing protein [Leucobacter tenebrionis]|uniref:HNH endonuclease signature motif containing protein n=1 Tax=Leucobacter tenebrionis TaxID=2873270 RepID=UPI001CA607C6|nr:HNH endonuclease signature motif containing protein [Leucobacter tenebrionis]QZY51625.1 HNH endonuclease [Leucobacter tenebrionis]
MSWVERLEWQQRRVDAGRLQLIAAAIDEVTVGDARAGFGGGASREIRYRSLRAELATALGVGEYQIESQMDLAFRLTHGFPATLSALEEAELSLAHARVVADAGMVIGAGDGEGVRQRRAGYENEVLGIAVRETPNRLRPIAQRIAERWAERPLETRHRDAAAQRCVRVVDGDDGMADLFARLPAVQAYAIHDRLTRIARAAERGARTIRDTTSPRPAETEAAATVGPIGAASAPAEPAATVGLAGSPEPAPRTRDQFRADAFADLLLGADERVMLAGTPGEAIRASVQIIVPAHTLTPGAELGGELGDKPGGAYGAAPVLSGHGPIDEHTARELAGHADTWTRVHTDPTGEVLSVDRYRPSEQMRRILTIRDQHCRFPGCRIPTARCDLDHTIDAAKGGPTSTDNLAHLCRGHHTLKHHGGWHVRQHRGGTLRWTSPTGRTHTDHPPGTGPSLGSAAPPDPESFAGADSASGARAGPVRFRG